jgi:hypothetical protein
MPQLDTGAPVWSLVEGSRPREANTESGHGASVFVMKPRYEVARALWEWAEYDEEVLREVGNGSR